MMIGGARNIPRGLVGVSEIGPGFIDKSKLRLGLGLGSVSLSEVLLLISMSLSNVISGLSDDYWHYHSYYHFQMYENYICLGQNQ